MLQKLLDTKRKPTIGGSGIEVIDDDGEDCEEQEIEDWEFTQEITSEEPITEGSSYGFANLRSDIFQRLREESSELFEYLEISTVKNSERTEMRVHSEQAKFDEDHYSGFSQAGTPKSPLKLAPSLRFSSAILALFISQAGTPARATRSSA